MVTRYMCANMPNIVINEVCSVNNSFLPDENGDCYDWIELYNPTDRVINLMGFGQAKGILACLCSGR